MTLPDLDTRRSPLGDDAVLIATGIAKTFRRGWRRRPLRVLVDAEPACRRDRRTGGPESNGRLAALVNRACQRQSSTSSG